MSGGTPLGNQGAKVAPPIRLNTNSGCDLKTTAGGFQTEEKEIVTSYDDKGNCAAYLSCV